ncbi:hypothetical protein V3C99_015797 [Haemonchus contortus]|uniref:Uncharacterized protein n=1 Tax=Haemonchus contortus TaxID=6289 RepID=A0A7I4YYS6_HAECO
MKKSERKEFLEEFQTIETEIPCHQTLSGADALLTALKTRLGEVKCEHGRILNKNPYKKEPLDTSGAAASAKNFRQKATSGPSKETSMMSGKVLGENTNDGVNPQQQAQTRMECNSSGYLR